MILKRVVVDGPEDLAEINGLVHDAYTDSDLLAFDEARREVRFPVAQEIDTWIDPAEVSLPPTKIVRRSRWPFGRHLIPFFQVNLTVRNVTSMGFGPGGLEDPWSLNEFVYDQHSGRLVLDPVVGPELVLDIGRLEIEAEITDHVAITIGRRTVLIVESDAAVDELQLLPLA